MGLRTIALAFGEATDSKINAFRPKGEKLPFLFSLISSLKKSRGNLEKSEE